jgi:uncharacterized protein (TIGR02145 family)
MKTFMKNILSIITIICVSLNLTFTQSGNVGIGTNNPHPSAGLDVNFTDKGFLPPRMTSAQRDAIISPASGLVIYNITSDCLNFFSGILWREICGTPPLSSFPEGFVHCDINNPTAIVEVINPVTGRIWMDRNLGASQVATSSSDAAAYGDLYQWGRFADGHQCRNSSTTIVTSNTDNPGHSYFVPSNNYPYDWRVPQNDNLWQGVNGINNPCPSGYRLPTETELDAERLSWVTNNAAGAYASPLKWTLAGFRNFSDGGLTDEGTYGIYWTSTVSSFYAAYIQFDVTGAFMYIYYRAGGGSVRCIKD